SSSPSQDYHRFLDAAKKEHYSIIQRKGVVQERIIDFPSITYFPRMQQITEGYSWMDFKNMIGVCNISWVEEFYANAYGCEDDDYTSYVRGVDISYAPNMIDTIFGFRPEEHCRVIQRRTAGHIEEEYAEMLHELALPSKDWRYDSHGRRSRLQATEMDLIAKAWANCIKRMITVADVYIGHPFVITTQCERLQVPTRDIDDIRSSMDPLRRKFFMKAQRDLQATQAAAAAPPSPPQDHQQHQVPPHFPQHHQYSDCEMGMAVHQYNMAWRMDVELP
ncbi:hypothetical protein A2U01_0025451, partial [Trifolium medium]|nr:hypothetical protein [Trifolium medium]